MLSTKDFNGNEFHAYCQQQYDEARRFLKTCGKPKDDIDRFLIEKHRADVSIFGGMLDMDKSANRIKQKEEAEKEAVKLRKRVDAIEKYLDD